MSVLSIAPYFPFRRIKIVDQTVTAEATWAHIHVEVVVGMGMITALSKCIS